MTENPRILQAMYNIKAEKAAEARRGTFTVSTFGVWTWTVIATGLPYDEAMLLADAQGFAKVEKEASSVPA